ncbi:MAG: hypothetical protein HWN68_07775 [Desulfobacterales bacterium]|nr:hypothetical protein [Desulfobacterales bacterium]
MKLKKYQLLLLLGISLIVIDYVALATVVYGPQEIVAWAPYGTTGEPTPLTPTTYQKDFGFVVEHAVSGETGWYKVDSISGDAYSEPETQLTRYLNMFVLEPNGWLVPMLSDDTILKFTFIYKNSEGTVMDSVEAYGIIGGPNGYFTINGEKADENLVLYVTAPDLDIRFYATEEGSVITKVKISVLKNDVFLESKELTEVVTDLEWSTTYTLPEYGAYTITGQMAYGGALFRKMTIYSTYSDSDGISLGGLGLLTVIGLISIGISGIMYFKESFTSRNQE